MGSRIWPGPECLNPAWPFKYDTHVGLFFYRCVVRVEAERRTRGIGEGRAKARRRMERFLAWLRAGGWDGSAMMAERRWSPEQAVMEHPGMVAAAMDVMTQRRWAFTLDEQAFARWLLASPEWKALPWQRDPEASDA